ncbi:hypothetical protein CUMW_269790 [Citrus unshiu]|uniref:Folate gamma-glutamyl hydrolase n=1 Tax=Citrus unshiu TaxID=55188 RepID=A0A2H5QWZ6_CITUN|nr:hypothetical protein CUMW_269790 [Citrus unshiu]
MIVSEISPELLKKLSTDCLVMQNHHYGISPERMQANQELAKFFKILTTSVNEYNKVYVSTVQAYNYPMTAFQWHPEAKLQFSFGIHVMCYIFMVKLCFCVVYEKISFCIHPVSPSQKNAFEWGPKAIPHTEDAIQVTQQAANFFIRYD